MYTHLSHDDRSTIFTLLRQKLSLRNIAKELGVSVSTISREIRRNRLQSCKSYEPSAADRRAKTRRRRASKQPRKLNDEMLRQFEALMEQYRSVYSAAHFMPVCTSALYNWLWQDAVRDSKMMPRRPCNHIVRQGAHRYMRFGVGHYRKRRKDGRFKVMRDAAPIGERPAIVSQCERYWDLEVDTMHWGKRKKSLTIRDRKSGKVWLAVVLPHSAKAVAKLLIRLLRGLPVRTITSDGGWEFSCWRMVEKALGVKWYVCDPGCPQQRGGVEHANGIVRRMVQADIGRYGLRGALRRAEKIINHRPTKRLNGRTPAEVLPV